MKLLAISSGRHKQSRMPPNKRVNNRPPPTREAEYKTIIDNVNSVCIQIRRFAKKYFDRKAVNYTECTKCLSKLVGSWRMEVSDFKTWKEFQEKLKTVKIDPEIRDSVVYHDLEYICDRAKKFEVMIPGIREQLVTCGREHLFKYCKSFLVDIGPLDIRPIFDYDEALKGYKKDIETKIDQINTNILTYGELKTPFDKFVSEGNVHGTLMEEVCVAVVEVSHVMKKWVSEDASYPDRLLQEVFFNNSYKEKLEDDVIQLHVKRRDIERSIERKHRSYTKTERQHDSYKREKRKAKNHLETVNSKIDRLSVDLENKNTEIDDLQTTISSRTPRSHRDKEELNLVLDKSGHQAERITEWRSVMERQKQRLEREVKQVSDRTYELKVEGVTLRHEEHELRQNLMGVGIEIKSIHERIASIDEKTETLKRIRVTKLSPDTLRRIHKRRIEPSSKGVLEDACKYVAQSIGKDWKKLYERLPFEPPRNPDKLQKDVHIIDAISARRYHTPEEAAVTSLDKWRVFNRHGDVTQLIRGLRKLNKLDLADQLESRYSVQGVYS